MNLTPDLEAKLLSELSLASEKARIDGFKRFRLASSATDPEERTRGFQETIAIYCSPLPIIANGFLYDDLSWETIQELRLEIIKTKINEFDAYRRMERLDEARTLGLETFAQAKELRDDAVINRAGNFLTLLLSAEAYHCYHSDPLKAMERFIEAGTIFEGMSLSTISPSEDMTNYFINKAANDFNKLELMADHPELQDHVEIDYGVMKLYVNSAHQSALTCYQFICDRLQPEPRANLEANLLVLNGNFAQYFEQDLPKAVEQYALAVQVSASQAQYGLSTNLMRVKLAEALALDGKYSEALVELGQVQAHLDAGGNLSIYAPKYLPMMERTRALLG